MVKDFFECQSTDPDTMLHVEIFTPSDMEIKGDIVNIGLHFILKNVRPYAAPCSEA